MATTPLPPDFSAFLKLLNEHEIKYLLVGGWAVGYYGYVRAAADIDVWIAREQENAERLVTAIRVFGFFVGANLVFALQTPPLMAIPFLRKSYSPAPNTQSLNTVRHSLCRGRFWFPSPLAGEG
jgi:hypothetical protein